VILYLHDWRLKEYRELMADIDKADKRLTLENTRDSVNSAWKYVNLPSFIAFQELLAASRTDAELRQVVEPVEKEFERHFLDTVKTVFPHWEKMPDLGAANDLVQFSMKGMALSHMSSRKNARARNVIKILTEVLFQIYKDHEIAEE
jgi:hypothetical protein